MAAPRATCSGGLPCCPLARRRCEAVPCRPAPRRARTCTAAPDGDLLQVARELSDVASSGPPPPVLWTPGADATASVDAAASALHTHKELMCTLSGLDAVECMLEDVPDDVAIRATPDPMAALMAAGGGGFSGRALQAAVTISPFAFWGTSMAAMRLVVPHTTPLLLGALRLLPAGLILVAWAAASGRPQPATPKAWAWVLAFALVDAAAFQGFLAEGLTRTSAGLGSVIIDSQPLSVAVLAAALFGERLSGVGVAGLLLGVAGLGLLELPGASPAEAAEALAAAVAGGWPQPGDWPLLGGGGGDSGGPGALLDHGEVWMLMAAQSMAVGTVMVRFLQRHVDPVIATGWHMVIGGAILAAVAAYSGAAADGGAAAAAAADAVGAAGGALAAPHAAPGLPEMAGSLASQLSRLTPADLAAMAYVSVLGGAAGYGVFFWLASHGSLTSLSSLTFLTPVFATGAGYLALGEVLTPMQLLGGAVTLSAVFLINHRPPAESASGSAKPQAERQ